MKRLSTVVAGVLSLGPAWADRYGIYEAEGGSAGAGFKFLDGLLGAAMGAGLGLVVARIWKLNEEMCWKTGAAILFVVFGIFGA